MFRIRAGEIRWRREYEGLKRGEAFDFPIWVAELSVEENHSPLSLFSEFSRNIRFIPRRIQKEDTDVSDRSDEIGWAGAALDRGLLLETAIGSRVGKIWRIRT